MKPPNNNGQGRGGGGVRTSFFHGRGGCRNPHRAHFLIDSAHVLPELVLGHRCGLDVLRIVRPDVEPRDVLAARTLV